jgi:hypothetical protein
MQSSTSDIALGLARLSLCFSLISVPNHDFLRMSSPKKCAENKSKPLNKNNFYAQPHENFLQHL